MRPRSPRKSANSIRTLDGHPLTHSSREALRGHDEKRRTGIPETIKELKQQIARKSVLRQRVLRSAVVQTVLQNHPASWLFATPGAGSFLRTPRQNRWHGWSLREGS